MMLEYYDSLTTFLKTQGVQLLRGLLVLVIGFFLVHWVLKLYDKRKKRVPIEATVWKFIDNLIRIVLYAIVILTAANAMGIPMTSVVTMIASAGVAISLAMQGALSNLVGGFLLLILQPVRVDEYVKIGDLEGTIQKVGVFYTELVTPDNRLISMPNSGMTNTAIVNFSRNGKRRMELKVSVSYSADIREVKAILARAISGKPAVLEEPEPSIQFSACADSSLDFIIRVWAKNADYWPLYYELTESVKLALDEAGIEIPYPQMDVHIQTSQLDMPGKQ